MGYIWFCIGYPLVGLAIGAYGFTTWPYVLVMYLTMSVVYLLDKGIVKTFLHAVAVCLVCIGIPTLVGTLAMKHFTNTCSTSR